MDAIARAMDRGSWQSGDLMRRTMTFLSMTSYMHFDCDSMRLGGTGLRKQASVERVCARVCARGDCKPGHSAAHDAPSATAPAAHQDTAHQGTATPRKDRKLAREQAAPCSPPPLLDCPKPPPRCAEARPPRPQHTSPCRPKPHSFSRQPSRWAVWTGRAAPRTGPDTRPVGT